MGNPFNSASWYGVAHLRPRLKSHVRVRRHHYRGKRWYVIDDGAAGRAHRFAAGAYGLIGRLDGRRSVAELWDRLVDEMGEEAPSQDDVIHALGQLHGADLIATDTLPDTAELLERGKTQRRQLWVQNLKSPMSIRIPLIDPDRFLERAMPWLRPLFSWAGALLWLAVVLPAAALAASHWTELTHGLIDRVLATHNLLVIALCYPVVKTIHELGHGFAAKANGREVREMGVMLLLFFPVPYVDASAASALQSKWQRAFVGAAGMLSELFVAALATYAWVSLEPGLARAFAFNVMLIAGVSTILVNGNPLLRFDGYYILADILEIPNLGQKANKYWAHLVDRHLFRTHGALPFDAARGERIWLAGYAPLAFAARMVMLLGIALVMAERFFIVGVLIALWTVWTGIGLPVWKMFKHVFSGPALHGNRKRAVRITLGGVAALALILFAVPAPHHAYTEGVVWLPEAAHVRAGSDGVVAEVAAQEGAIVRAGQPLVISTHPALEAEVAQLAWQAREMQAQADSELDGDRVKREISQVSQSEIEKKLAIKRQQLGELEVRAGSPGRFLLSAAPANDLPGRFLQKGDLIGYVTPGHADVARIAVAQADIDLVRDHLGSLRFRLANMPGRSFDGHIVRIVPGATRDLPSRALATESGGPFPVDPRDAKGKTALNRVFLFDIDLPRELSQVPFGTRVFVRFTLDWEPLGWQAARRVRQMLLARFDA